MAGEGNWTQDPFTVGVMAWQLSHALDLYITWQIERNLIEPSKGNGPVCMKYKHTQATSSVDSVILDVMTFFSRKCYMCLSKAITQFYRLNKVLQGVEFVAVSLRRWTQYIKASGVRFPQRWSCIEALGKFGILTAFFHPEVKCTS